MFVKAVIMLRTITALTKEVCVNSENFNNTELHFIVLEEIKRAKKLHDWPDDIYKGVSIVMEELGEVSEALNDFDDTNNISHLEEARKEIVHVICTCYRFYKKIYNELLYRRYMEELSDSEETVVKECNSIPVKDIYEFVDKLNDLDFHENDSSFYEKVYQSGYCCNCGGPKYKGHVLCGPCYKILPIGMHSPLLERENFKSSFFNALNALIEVNKKTKTLGEDL